VNMTHNLRSTSTTLLIISVAYVFSGNNYPDSKQTFVRGLPPAIPGRTFAGVQPWRDICQIDGSRMSLWRRIADFLLSLWYHRDLGRIVEPIRTEHASRLCIVTLDLADTLCKVKRPC
jgi:hypothetical protein